MIWGECNYERSAPKGVEVSLGKPPLVCASVLAHPREQKVNDARLDPRVFARPVNVVIERKGHVVHPPSRTRRGHDRCGVVMVVKVDPTVAAVVLSPASKCIDPIRSLLGNVVLNVRDTRERIAEPGCVCACSRLSGWVQMCKRVSWR